MELPVRPLALTFCLLTTAAGAALAQGSAAPPSPDPRIGLKAGWFDAASAAWNMRLVSTTPPSDSFINRNDPGNFGMINSDISFKGTFVIQGNFSGYQVWNVADPAHPRLATWYICPGSQSDVSVYRNLMFVSHEAASTRVDCGNQGIHDTVSADRARGIRIFDITDLLHPRAITIVQTCRGSHTHTVVTDPRDTANIYVYISGSAPVRSPRELPGCSGAQPDQDSNSTLFKIEVIQVPLAHPEQAHVVSTPPILTSLTPVASHGPGTEDSIAQARRVAQARANGGFVANVNGNDAIMGPGFVTPRLDSIMKARGGTGAPSAEDTAALRANLQAIVTGVVGRQRRTGPTQCHDITVYPAIGLAGGACGGYGLLLDIRDAAHPVRVGAVSDSNFAFWHSATFNNDGTKVLFSDEWGGGLQPRCRPTDRMEWGADAIFTISGTTMTFGSYYKMPAPQTAFENCVAHNGSLIPIPGRDVMAQGWYQGGVSVFDWTNAAHAVEIAYFDRGPMDSTKLVGGAGSWSAYWYNGYVYSSEIARGLDVFELLPSAWLSQNEIDAANLVRVDYLNVQDQQRFVWPAAFVVARAYCDQLARSGGLAAARLTTVRAALARAEHASSAQRRSQLTRLATQLDSDAPGSSDQAKVRMLASEVRDIAARR
jgi:hypothetical protein